MFDFELDNSSYFDFSTKDKMDFVIKQNSELPILELIPIKTKNFDELVKYIKTATITFSMYDNNNCPKILDKEAFINLDTPNNNYNKIDNTCENIVDFTIKYFFTKKDTSNSGLFRGEFKIVFLDNLNEKTLIVPINNNLNINITPSHIK